MSRGPYRKPSKLTVKDKSWQVGDVVMIGRRRWIIRTLKPEVTLVASNSGNHRIRWTTTLNNLPKKAPTP
ncbi:hypothetical protein [Microbacterium sp.]|uniref:hypothetical protein n=1 Tax=Microbacterium sp. TaxID=51671 RepID=UPI003F710899